MPKTMRSEQLERHRALVARVPMLEREEELAIARRFRGTGDRKAANRLAEAHQRTVLALAVKYRRYGVPLGEMIAEGNCGLVHALRKFDPERGVRFGTYASYWIRAYMLAYVLRSWSIVARRRFERGWAGMTGDTLTLWPPP